MTIRTSIGVKMEGQNVGNHNVHLLWGVRHKTKLYMTNDWIIRCNFLKWKTKNKNMNIICGNAEVHTNKQRREQPEIWSKQPIWCRTCPPDGNMLLPGVIWSNRGPIVALWFDHANHCGKKRKKKKKASMNRSVCVCVCVCGKRSSQHVSVKLSTFKQFLGILLGIKAAPSVSAITLKFKLCVRWTCVRDEYETACV